VEEKLADKIGLENGLTLELYDCSRPVAGDRWLVSFVARIEVDVKSEYFEGRHRPDVSLEGIRAAVGERVLYRHEKRRNFIAESEKGEVFEGLKERFLGANLGYLASPDFPYKLILRKYQEAGGPSLTRQLQ
jgi:hypothetical protein